MTLTQCLKKIAQSISPAFFEKIKATSIQQVSSRSLRFDVPDSPQGINRIKVTANEDGTARITFIQMIEFDVMDAIPADRVQNVIDGILKFDPAVSSSALSKFMKGA